MKEVIMKKNNLRFIVVSAVMGAVGAVLMFVEFPLPFIPSFIKFDFSEIPVLLTSFACGPWYGVLVCLIKNLLHLFSGSSAGIGELSNFILGAFLAVAAGYIYKRNKNRKSALVAALTASLVMALASIVSNYFLIYPLYTKVLGLSTEMIMSAYSAILPSADTLLKDLLIFNVPFTFAKGIIDSAVCFVVYKRLSPVMKGAAK